MKRYIYVVGLSILFVSTSVFSYQKTTNSAGDIRPDEKNVLVERQQDEKEVLSNSFAITLYKQNYLLPFYYTRSPYNAVYVNETPSNESLKRTEVKYQLSFKVPIWDNILSSPTSLYFAYTQLSYWQLYNKKAFFRSTDYEPEIFTLTKLNWHLGQKWFLNFFKVGAVHQSNGFGNNMERSWNRVYLEASASNDHALISVRPWYVFHDATYQKYNSDMSKYLGYGEILLAYKWGKQVLSLQSHSLLEHAGRYATGTLTYSYSLTPHINIFAQVFSGYGQSLIEYNHRTNSFGLGLSLNNFI